MIANLSYDDAFELTLLLRGFVLHRVIFFPLRLMKMAMIADYMQIIIFFVFKLQEELNLLGL